MQFSKSLPPYTPSPPAPSYSDQPSTGEQSLQYTPRVGRAYVLPDSTYVKQFGRYSVVFLNQEQDARIPTYRQDALVSGYIELPLCGLDRVTEVSVLIEGRLDLSIAGTHTDSVKTMHSTTVLWKKPRHSHPSVDGESTATCPTTVQFAIPTGRSFVDADGETQPLPPTFQTLDFIESGLFARSSYRLRFTVKCAPKLGPRIALLEKTKHFFVPFDYRPRTRSQHPASRDPTSLASIKALPDDWFQSTSTVEVPATYSDGRKFEPVTANLLIPNPRVYALADSIPFHFQLSGTVNSLRALVAPDTLQASQYAAPPAPHPRSPSRPSTASSSSPPPQRHCIKKLQGQFSTSGSLRVFLLRQIRVEVRGKVRVQNAIIGEARLEAVPPPVGADDGPGRQEYLSWVGRVAYGDLGPQGVARNLNPEMDVGGFHVGNHLKVNDFVALSVGSQNPPWKDVVSSIGIKFVTESWDVDYENGV
ncbi:hypothetical protein FA15DRAFT_581417 [Coprinopsis marcescibilis]|uniref:Arrestin-like N-terminal domain-containing protein n=1 Tax=Coprinopsis marcescibilis TaxID=230819 RepID=A0A5C3LCB5_COPMA|nr:hypothetical protein FA15DRAFT_581417 [Coprinopsis marcescibilis]